MLIQPAKTNLAADVPADRCESHWVDDCWRDMQQRAARGQTVRSDDYLAGAKTREDAVDVIYAEFVLRKHHGGIVCPQEFLDRFPEYIEPLRRQFALDGVLSSLNSAAHDTLDNTKANMDGAPIPTRIGKYTVVARLSSGGQADVFRAVHPELKQEVVIKLAATGCSEAAHRQQLLSEGRILAELDHPRLARVYDVDFDDAQPFLVSRYVRGRTLDEYARQESLTLRAAAVLMASVARGLAAAHRVGIAHLDVKPRNIVVDDNCQPCLIDFGLATTQRAFEQLNLQSGSLRGTLAFMAPEQARGESDLIGPQCDIFGLGAVLFFLVIGEPPFAIAEFPKMLEMVQHGAWRRELLERKEIPSAMRRILATALAPTPENRYRSCDDFADALDRFSGKHSITRRGLFAAIAATSLAMIAGWYWMNGRNRMEDNSRRPFPPVAVVPPRLTVQVARGERYVDLVETAPLETSDRLRVRSSIPAGCHATLLLLSSEGELKELCRVKPSSSEIPLRFPRQSGQAVPLIGPAGTEVVLLCGRRDGPFTVADFHMLVGKPGALPRLPALSVLTADMAGVHVQQAGREFGAPEDRPDPEEEVMDQLNRIRQSLSLHVDFLHIVAFCHED